MGLFGKKDETKTKEELEADLAKLKAFAALTPQEMAKKMEEAQKAAQEAFDKLTPEEQARAKAEAERLMRESEQERKALLEEAQKFGLKVPKFCPYCGTENKGGNFCPNCGAPYKTN
ncbi:MAG: hypothetical protein J6N70_12005 [Oribacterium sp.]|nr:hypothetical protein [Oribacterium sp.]